MDKLRLDLESLEVERLDVSVIGSSGSLELFGMGHASAELAHSCEGDNCNSDCAGSACDCTSCGN